MTTARHKRVVRQLSRQARDRRYKIPDETRRYKLSLQKREKRQASCPSTLVWNDLSYRRRWATALSAMSTELEIHNPTPKSPSKSFENSK